MPVVLDRVVGPAGQQLCNLRPPVGERTAVGFRWPSNYCVLANVEECLLPRRRCPLSRARSSSSVHGVFCIGKGRGKNESEKNTRLQLTADTHRHSWLRLVEPALAALLAIAARHLECYL